jgi:phage tail sheath protein FI
MPEYLAPGVYVEETSFRTKSIEGVATTTTGFVGPTRYGPLFDPPDVLTSLAEFERVYGDGQPLEFGDIGQVDNYMWHGVRAFFTEGGGRLYVRRIFSGDVAAGTATGQLAGGIPVAARHPGAAGEMQVSLALRVGQNVLSAQKDPVSGASVPVARGLVEHDVVLVSTPALGSPPREDVFASAELVPDPVTGRPTWQFVPATSSPPHAPIPLSSLDPGPGRATVQVITLAVSVTPAATGALPLVWPGLPLDARHRLGGAPDSAAAVFAAGVTGADAPPIVLDLGAHPDGLAVLEAVGRDIDLRGLTDPATPPGALSFATVLQGGGDGDLPTDAAYEGTVRADDTKTGLVAFEDLEDIAIVAAPGATATYAQDPDHAHAVINGLIAHAQKMRYRIAVIEAGKGLTVAQVRAMRAQHDTEYAAFYYPWVTILDPITNQPADMPPAGFVAGIYARNDVNRAVYKAPANEVVNLAIGFERPINKAQQEVLNPEGVNCFRFFEGRGFRLWGARLMSSDPEWPYVNLRRYFAFLEHSIDLGTQWAVFEPNGELLWANVRGTIADFLLEQWHEGALLGDKPEKAYFVRCDRSTMTQNDIDNGRLVCLIGVAVVRPAEFVIFRIGQWTADAQK